MSSTITSQQKRSKISSIRQLSRPDEWAIAKKLKVDGHTFSLEGREYVTQVIRDSSEEIIIPKAAQMCFTVTFLVRTLHWIVERRWHHLYLLPFKIGAIPFVQARIDPIIESNPVLDQLFSRVDNRLHKQSKDAVSLYIRGTNINRELQEIPVDVEVWDERDRMVEDNLDEARKRMDGSRIKKLAMLSTPTAPGHGVDSDDGWVASDQHEWEVPCPHCKRYQVFLFEANVRLGDSARECVFECVHCHREITDEQRWQLNKHGRWVPQNLNGHLRGYHINQFNSCTQRLPDILRPYFKGISDKSAMKAFMNGSLGLPYVAEGDQFTPELLDSCREREHRVGGIPNGPVFVGVDVGTYLHVRADTLTAHGHRQTWQFKIFQEWDELDKFLDGLVSFTCVIDAHPEKRAARDLSIKYSGRVWLGFEQDRDQNEALCSFGLVKHAEASKVAIDRTLAFDTLISRYMNGRIILPANARELGEHVENRDYNGFYYQMIQMVREEEPDVNGRIRARWKKNRNHDHWHHADMFCEIACQRVPSLIIPASVSSAFKGASIAS